MVLNLEDAEAQTLSKPGAGSAGLRRLLPQSTDRPDIGTLLRNFRPPPRFGDRTFENYDPRHPTQAAALERMRVLARSLREASSPRSGWFRRLLGMEDGNVLRGSGVYLDGSFGVGKTHLLAAVWHEAPAPAAYLSFDELMYLLGMLGPAAGASAFDGYRLIAVDEWELDDPGNLKIALAFLRSVVKAGICVVVTSNTLPIELGNGRFSQKDFLAEIEELAGTFEVVRIEGNDYRQRRFEVDPGHGYFQDAGSFSRLVAQEGEGALVIPFDRLLEELRDLHPIRYREIARSIDVLFLEDLAPIHHLADALRWVHFVDSVYDAGCRMAATSEIALSHLFTEDALGGPYAKKLSRCLSRLEELLG